MPPVGWTYRDYLLFFILMLAIYLLIANTQMGFDDNSTMVQR